MAKTRNGTRMASGSSPKPNSWMVPNCHITDTSEQNNGKNVIFQLRCIKIDSRHGKHESQQKKIENGFGAVRDIRPCIWRSR